MQNWGGGGGQTECIMGNWKIEKGKYATRVLDEALYEFYECSVFNNYSMSARWI